MISDWTNIVSNVGFPIAAFVMMFWMTNRTIRENTKAIREMIVLMKK